MTELRCPCCGGALPAGSVTAADLAGLVGGGRKFRAIVKRLAKSPGVVVSHEQLIGFIYQREPGGGPEWARQSITVMVRRNRRRLAALGWRIDTVWGSGLRLVALSAEADRGR